MPDPDKHRPGFSLWEIALIVGALASLIALIVYAGGASDETSARPNIASVIMVQTAVLFARSIG